MQFACIHLNQSCASMLRRCLRIITCSVLLQGAEAMMASGKIEMFNGSSEIASCKYVDASPEHYH